MVGVEKLTFQPLITGQYQKLFVGLFFRLDGTCVTRATTTTLPTS